jgi:hypothetical protein
LGEQDPLALAAGEVSEPPRSEVLDVERTLRLGDELAIARAETPHPAEVAVATHANDVGAGDWERGLDVDLLGDERDPAAGEAHSAGLRPNQADGGAKEGALAGAVRSQQRRARAGGQVEADVVKRRDVSKRNRQPLGRERRFGHRALLTAAARLSHRAHRPWISTSWPLTVWRRRFASLPIARSRPSSSNAVRVPQESQST